MSSVGFLLVLLCGLCCCNADNHEAATTAEAATTTAKPPTASAKVLIIGAGMSGLTAARTLEAGGIKDFVVLEGSGRTGGRLLESKLGTIDVEHGALWVHGGEGNPVYDLVRRFNVSYVDDDGEDYIVRNAKGEDRTDELDEAYEAFEQAMEHRDNKSVLMLSNHQPDMTQRAVFQQGGWFPRSPEEMSAEFFEIDFDYSHAPSETSTKYPGEYTYEDFTDEDFVTSAAYSSVTTGLADELFSENDSTRRLFLDTVVSEIHQEEDKVRVLSQNGDVFVADHVIVTASLGVLQHKLIKFEPDLPGWKWDSIQGFQFAHYLHFYMLFPSTFWDNNQYIIYTSPRRGHYPVWQNFNKLRPGSNIIQCSVTQYEAIRLYAMTDAQIQAEAMAVLQDMYGPSIPQPVSIVVPRFGTNPLFMGSYSNWPPGYTMDSFNSLKASVRRVHFAGEYCSFRYYGYLHGALLSGKETAEQVISSMEKNDLDEYVPPYEARGCPYKAASNYMKGAQLDDGSCKFKECPFNSARQLLGSGWIVLVSVIVAIVQPK